MQNKEDLIQWPDGTWCFAHELPDFAHKSDDYVRVAAETPAWHAVLNAEEPFSENPVLSDKDQALREAVIEAFDNAKRNGEFEPHGHLRGRTDAFIADDLATCDADIEELVGHCHKMQAKLVALVKELRPS